MYRRWKRRREYIIETLANEMVGMRATDECYWQVHFAHLKLGVLDTHKMQFQPSLRMDRTFFRAV